MFNADMMVSELGDILQEVASTRYREEGQVKGTGSSRCREDGSE
jgi:hypothetical protein